MTKIFIDGAAGTTGLEIRARLRSRSDISFVSIPDALRKDEGARRDALNAADVSILCLPDDAARAAVALIENPQTRVIDASSAHRVADGWTYGFPELVGPEKVAAATRIANPGCYPTGFLALIAPLTAAGLVRTDYPYSVHAVSGYSGGGKLLIERFEADDEVAWRGYAYSLNHKHLAEMRRYAGLAQSPVFAPAVVPAFRGMVVEVPVTQSAFATAGSMRELHSALQQHYATAALIDVADWDDIPEELVLARRTAPSDAMRLWCLASPDGSQARLVARLDNLGKGASGAAIQSLNLITGQPETTSLRL